MVVSNPNQGISAVAVGDSNSTIPSTSSNYVQAAPDFPSRSYSLAVDTAWRSSHEMDVYCMLADVNGNLIANLQPTAGSVTIDGRRSVRRSMEMTLPDYSGSLMPTTNFDTEYPLGPFSQYTITIYRSIIAGFGQVDVPLGVFRPTDLSITNDHTGTTLAVSGEDLSGMLAQPWNTQYQVAAGTNVNDAITNVLNQWNIPLTFNLASTTYTTPQLTFGTDSNSSPWQDACLIAQASGMALYMDYAGRVTTSLYPSFDDVPDYTLDSGSTGVLLSLKRSFKRQAVNGVIVTAEGTGLLTPLPIPSNYGASIDGYWIIDPSCALRYNGPFGANATKISNPIFVSADQMNGVAPYLLNSVAGVQMDLEIVPNPYLDAMDVVAVYDQDSGVDLAGIVDCVKIPLTPSGSSTVTIRALGLS
jgi:hypothetical protein